MNNIFKMFHTGKNNFIPALLIVSGLVLSGTWGCTSRSPEALLNKHQVALPEIDNLVVCVSYGCRHRETTLIDSLEWEQVREMMESGDGDSPEHERQRVSWTIGLLERIVGPKVGTEHNKGRNREGPPGSRQLDCIADTVNTTTYLLLLSRENLLINHEVVEPARKGPLRLSYWHKTAVMEEKGSGKRFAVDPWFFDNGRPAAVLPLEEWRSGDYPVAE